MMAIGEGVVPFDLVYLHTKWAIVTVLKRCRERKLRDRLSTLLLCFGGLLFPSEMDTMKLVDRYVD